MWKIKQRCVTLLDTLSSLKNKEEYTDTLTVSVYLMKSLLQSNPILFSFRNS